MCVFESLGENCLNCGTQRFRICALFHHKDLVIARASVDVAHIDLIEHIVECLPIVHLAIQTA